MKILLSAFLFLVIGVNSLIDFHSISLNFPITAVTTLDNLNLIALSTTNSSAITFYNESTFSFVYSVIFLIFLFK